MAGDAYTGVRVSVLLENGEFKNKYEKPVTLQTAYDPHGISITVKNDGGDLFEFPISRTTECCKVGRRGYLFELDVESLLFTFASDADAVKFRSLVSKIKVGKELSVFTERTEDSSASQYFQFYGYLSQQQNMMQDYIRTSTYQRAILSNLSDFKDKVVLDVGAGSGILSFFAVQAGAAKVYAIEASTMAQHAETLAKSNGVGDKLKVIAGKVEEIELPEKVDVIISEPMGYMLFNERMLETYLHAKKWLKPGGKMFPTRGDLHVAPFTDETLYMEQFNKANFWYQQSFHGVDLSSLREAAIKEYFRQPVVDTFDIRICLAKSVRHVVDFLTAPESDLHRIEIPLEFHVLQSGLVHGLAFWFDVAFLGSSATVWLSTAATEPLTHWYQVRCLLETPLFVKQGQLLTGSVLLLANKRQSYDVTIDLRVESTGATSSNTLDLKNPYFRYAGQPAQPPPGTSTTSPSESYWAQLDMQGARQAVNMVNGMTVNGLGEVAAAGAADASAAAANTSMLGLENQGLNSAAHLQRPQATQMVTSTLNSTQQLVLGAMSQYPLSNSLMIGDYVTPGSMILPTAALSNIETFQP